MDIPEMIDALLRDGTIEKEGNENEDGKVHGKVLKGNDKRDEGKRQQQHMQRIVDYVLNTPAIYLRSKSSMSGSSNRFEILNSAVDYDDEGTVESKATIVLRQARAASAGVAELMNNFKTKRKGPVGKGKEEQSYFLL
ncbi:hypothetical protein DITRI_Ditri12bG0006500 [Diplodiscus trichospermus]